MGLTLGKFSGRVYEMEPYQRVLLFSGGRTSGYMLKRMLDQYADYREKWITIFCNTGKEREETLDFVHAVEEKWLVPIIWLEYHRVLASTIPINIFPSERRNANLAKAALQGETAHWFKRVTYESASRNGEPFDELLHWASVLPNVASRICSVQLKMRTAMRFLISIGIYEYSPIIGIRKDEEHRSTQILASCDKHEHPEFPLIESGISEPDVMEFWKHNDFDLQLESYEGNCDLCFLKATWKRLKLIQRFPDMPKWWMGWEKRKSATCVNGASFRLGETYEELQKQALHPDQIEFCFTNSLADIPCSCAERGFGSTDEI